MAEHDAGGGTTARRPTGGRYGSPKISPVRGRPGTASQTLASKAESLRSRGRLATSAGSLACGAAEAFSAAQDLSRARNEITSLDLQKQGNVVRLENFRRKKSQLEEERTRLETRFARSSRQCSSGETERATQRARLRAAEPPGAIHEELNLAAKSRIKFSTTSEQRSRLERARTICRPITKDLAPAPWQRSSIATCLGSLADKIHVPNEFVTAIETALGIICRLS